VRAVDATGSAYAFFPLMPCPTTGLANTAQPVVISWAVQTAASAQAMIPVVILVARFTATLATATDPSVAE
jgi:hypothetical protein